MISIIKSIGEETPLLKPILILFGESAPAELRDICVMHKHKSGDKTTNLKPGSSVIFGEQAYIIDSIGETANETLSNLGHISFYFNEDEDVNLLPGSARLSPKIYPELKLGDIIEFID